MEIYRLKDKVPEGRVRENFDGKSALRATGLGDGVNNDEKEGGSILRITEMKQGVKNPNRVNVYVNGRYSFSLDVAQVVDLLVEVGRVLTESELAELKRASEFGKAYQRALEWVLIRPRSVRELRDYLKRCEVKRGAKNRKEGWEKYDFNDLIIERICERGYVDDRKFAEFWVENRFVKKGVSKRRLTQELIQKGVAKEIIDEVLDGRDDEEEIRKMILKKRAKYDDSEKLMAYLCRQGFSYELVRRVLEEED